MLRHLLTTYNSYPAWLRRAWVLACFTAGVLLTLAIPITPPGGYVEQVQRIFTNLNFAELLGRGALSLLVTLLLGLGVGGLLLAASLLLAGWQPGPARPPRRWEWLRYALPMLAVWSIYLLAFWPAMMSSDSTHAWKQAVTGQFDNGNPLLYLLVVSLFRALFNTPAAVAIAQVIGLSLLVAWGLGMLREHGLPPAAAWLVTLLFAVSPVNGALSVTVWKDIPYSMAVLAFSLLALRLVLRPAEIRRRGLWIGLGLLAAPVGLLRYNGLVIAPMVFVILGLAYRSHWKVFARALLLFAALWWLVQTPFAAALKVEKTSPVAGTLAMHHIAAHIHYGTPIAPADRETLERIMPLDTWHYYCYLVNPVLFNSDMDLDAMMASLGELNGIALRLMLENPTVDINQLFCASSLVYRVLPPFDGYFYAAAITPDGTGGGSYLWPNELGLVEAPILPGLSRELIFMLEATRNGGFSWLIWRPALYLYLFLFLGAAYALRSRSWKPALFLLPGAVHSAVLFAVNISQGFRYQYPVYLLALFAIALIFLPGEGRGWAIPRPPGRVNPS